jgi:hypothetical protein
VVEKAIIHYVHKERQRSQNTHAHAHRKLDITTEESKVPKRLLRQRDEIVAYLEREYYPEADLLKKYDVTRVGVNFAHLKEAISFVIGGDPRTITSGLDKLKRFDLIKEIDTNRFEFKPYL